MISSSLDHSHFRLNALSTGNSPFIISINSPVQPIHPAHSTSANIAKINCQHYENQKIFCPYQDIEKALCNQLLAPVPAFYLSSTLSDPAIRFGNVPAYKLSSISRPTTASSLASKLNVNMECIKKPWHPPTAIEALNHQIHDGVVFATAGADTPSHAQAI
jgi:hypothetical protein